ncbi:hypothetical protein H257_18333 [Aphanomyces astaci]|uniref:Uncharacterized protein n=1 Tax=Aphanomyces astaci TaxID=112090 RepID=W4FDP1_APHAT|nr:hypothetical protein H257_18333 [Aphanomyces astaci]ETV64853.1 hypothetical protein H257_18333 [Aphanomyces astaci]|eukprot:XP_009845672.1 hypothetical protein H257_18333 [Aphanomyces astaci]
MATQNALPPLSQDWIRKKSAGSVRQLQSTASSSVRKLNMPHSASFTRTNASPIGSPSCAIEFLNAQQLIRPTSSSTSQPNGSEHTTPSLTSREYDAENAMPRNPHHPQSDNANENQLADVMYDDDEGVKSTVHNHLQGGGGVTDRDSTSAVHVELQRMNQANALLKLEISRLQESLMQRLRGNAKFVGGGQFRSMAQSVAPASPKTSTCSNCFNARAALKKAKLDLKTHKPALDALQAKISESLAARYHLTEANARANDTIASLQAELHTVKESAVEQGNLVEKLRRDLDQQSNTGTAASSAESPPPPLLDDTLKQKYHIQVQISLEKQAQIDQLILDATASSANVRHMQRDMDTLRHDQDQVKASLSMCESQLRQELDRANAVSIKHHADMTSLRQTLDTGHLTAARDADAWHAREKSLLDQVLALTQERDALIDRLERAEASHKQHLQDMQRESQHLQLLRRKSCGDVVDLTNKYDAALTTVATLQKERDMWHHEQRAADDTIERMASELKTNHMQLEALEQAVLAQKCEKSGLELKLTKLETTYTTLCQSHSQTVADLKDHMDKLTVAQTQVIKQRSQVHALQVELKATNADKDAVHDKLMEQQATHTKALEKAMQSLVRLCVVAPTVNVHLSGQILPCKTVLPKDAIRTIVQRDILPVFSSIFLQDQEGTSPTGSSLDSWLQSLLKEMQTSIETHLKNVFQV